MDLQEKASHFPTSPGVYLMKDAEGRVLYVGKAKNLRVRVRTYFRDGADGRAHVRFLMGKVADIDVLVTDSEKEALILENSLIKKHRPRYNINLRDDKTYLSLRLDVQNDFPRLTTTRQVRKDGALYFGPYSSARSLRETVELIYRIFPLRQCSDRELKNRSRPCLYCQIRGCLAPCCGLTERQVYRDLVDQVVLFLKGRREELASRLREDMKGAAARLDFEEAARLRDHLRAVELTLERQKVVTHQPVDRDVIAMLREGSEVQVAVLVIRAGTLLDRRSYYISDARGENAEVLSQFLQQYYRGDRIVPAEVVVGVELDSDESSLLEEWLSEKRGKRTRIYRPHRGERAELLHMAGENAANLMQERRRTKVGYDAALRELEQRLNLPGPPHRMECYDISNVQGRHAVGSMVTFVDGFPDKGAYRRFSIRTVQGADDFAMLYEVLQRRLGRREGEWQLPDLIVVDGGKGQLGMVLKAAEDAGLSHLPVIGLAKSRVQQGASETVEHSPERVFLPGRKNPVVLAANSSALFLLQRIRDEAHRFAITYHRKKRSGDTLRSVLETIPGVGEKRRSALLKHFGSAARLRRASAEEIAGVPGISTQLAKTIAEVLGEEARR